MSQLALTTPAGRIVIRLRPDAAPTTVAFVKALLAGGCYEGATIYRAEPGFVLQGGVNKDRPRPAGLANPPLEFSLPNKRGTVTMARWEDTNSGSGEFFVNLADNGHLDRTGSSGWALGFAVWGEVVEGMDVAAALSARPATVKGGLKMLDAPVPFSMALLG